MRGTRFRTLQIDYVRVERIVVGTGALARPAEQRSAMLRPVAETCRASLGPNGRGRPSPHTPRPHTSVAAMAANLVNYDDGW